MIKNSEFFYAKNSNEYTLFKRGFTTNIYIETRDISN